MRFTALLSSIGLAAALTGGFGPAPAAPPQVSSYQLGPTSALRSGFLGPRGYAIQSSPLRGTFALTFTRQDPGFTSYEIDDVRWSAGEGSSSTPLTGSGTYRVGGEPALQHQMTLDLRVGGGAVRHLDSGLVPAGRNFPAIVIDVPLRVDAPQDSVVGAGTVIHLDAAPAKRSGIRP